jgi:hypothetical protein
MKTKPSHLKVVDKAPKPPEDGLVRIAKARNRLEYEALRYVKGATGEAGDTIPERIREASDLAGIARAFLEAEARK